MIEGETESKYYARIKRGLFSFEKPEWKAVSREAKDLVSKLLVVDPTKRLSATEALMHPWVTGEAHTDLHNQHLVQAQEVLKARLQRKIEKEKKREEKEKERAGREALKESQEEADVVI